MVRRWGHWTKVPGGQEMGPCTKVPGGQEMGPLDVLSRREDA